MKDSWHSHGGHEVISCSCPLFCLFFSFVIFFCLLKKSEFPKLPHMQYNSWKRRGKYVFATQQFRQCPSLWGKPLSPWWCTCGTAANREMGKRGRQTLLVETSNKTTNLWTVNRCLVEVTWRFVSIWILDSPILERRIVVPLLLLLCDPRWTPTTLKRCTCVSSRHSQKCVTLLKLKTEFQPNFSVCGTIFLKKFLEEL